MPLKFSLFLIIANAYLLHSTNELVSEKLSYYYSAKYFTKIKLCSKEKIISLNSEMACFDSNLNFTMGTNKPLFKMDGESPSRLVNLEPFCIDKTEVSNFQFMIFQLQTSYVTQVKTY